MTGRTTQVLNLAQSVEEDKSAAQQAAIDAQFTANSAMWSASVNYSQGQNAISPINFQTYRRKVAGVSATDPSADAANWEKVGTDAYSKEETYSKAQANALLNRVFTKENSQICAWTKTGAGTVSTATKIVAEVAGDIKTINPSTAVTMPSLSAGTDYAIWLRPDGVLECTSNFTTPPVANSRQLGGFHYAPGGNASGTSGGNTTPQINEFSMWDLKFRPACADPRGMALVADGFWTDIYLLGVDHHINGSSKFNVTIADGASPPKRPLAFGGNGTLAYSSLNWWEAAEVMRSHGKRLPTYSEFAALAYGTTEASSGGTDPVSTILRNAYTSKWGVMLASGNLWTWGDEFGGGAAAASWTDNTGGRGSTYQMENAVRFGGNCDGGANAGSRCSDWDATPTVSIGSFSARGVCDHLRLE
jgi:hypothetical protein